MTPRLRFVSLSLTAALALLLPTNGQAAGLAGQPAPSLAVVEKMRAAVSDLLKGDIGTARPALLLLVEANATTDLTDALNRAVGDDTTYSGLAATLDEAATNAKTDSDRAFAVYNLARLHLLRARLVSAGTRQRAPLAAAAQATERFSPTLRDPAAWELKGDIASVRGDVDAAIAAYRKMTVAGGNSGYSLYKQGVAYARANRAAPAQSSLENALRAENIGGGGGPALKYNLYQELAGVYLMQGNDPAALLAFGQSIRFVPAPSADPTFRYRTDIARRLLPRNQARVVLNYAETALRRTLDDFDLQSLRDDARAAVPAGGRRVR